MRLASVQKNYEEQVRILAQKIQEADAIIVGAASGMSAAAGYHYWYESDELFLKEFGEFKKHYGTDGAFNTFYYPYRTSEERWAFIAKLVHLIYESKTGKAYYDLMDLIQNKNYYVVTTNQDIQFTRVVPEDRLSAIQGDWRYFQCGRRCHDEIYFNKEQIYKMNHAVEGTRIPSELVPHCPKCGAEMEPWIRSYVFLEGKKYQEEYNKYNAFLLKNRERKVLFLELGVGRMTPMFIQEPFWKMTYAWPHAYYVSINPWDALLPEALEEKGMAIHADIAKVLVDTKCILREKTGISC